MRDVYFVQSVICVICQHVYSMSKFNTIFPAIFAGSSDYLDSFFVQFEIACEINSWPDNQKAYWLCQLLEGSALSFINGLFEKVSVPVNHDVLKQPSCLFYLSFNFDFYVSKIMRL